MPGPTIDYRISFGNILVMVAMLGSLGVGWGVLNSSSTNLTIRHSELAAAVAAQESRIRSLEMTSARVDERMILILDSLRKIEHQLDMAP
ncbi:hypothetical protein [Ketogulonicigenium vulgare]|uniref:hypothetical protein n=1 Tax=Ketogulonicigenium vulgare TaxID=92945 RepID=UPI0023584C12|nr:hypothetical protein [Ketogulonicigenium vulgare]